MEKTFYLGPNDHHDKRWKIKFKMVGSMDPDRVQRNCVLLWLQFYRDDNFISGEAQTKDTSCSFQRGQTTIYYMCEDGKILSNKRVYKEEYDENNAVNYLKPQITRVLNSEKRTIQNTHIVCL